MVKSHFQSKIQVLLFISAAVWDPVVTIDSVSYKFVSIPGNTVSLVLVRRYSAHAMASRAQDCPDWQLERSIHYPRVVV